MLSGGKKLWILKTMAGGYHQKWNISVIILYKAEQVYWSKFFQTNAETISNQAL
jgi:hypothetical protein